MLLAPAAGLPLSLALPTVLKTPLTSGSRRISASACSATARLCSSVLPGVSSSVTWVWALSCAGKKPVFRAAAIASESSSMSPAASMVRPRLSSPPPTQRRYRVISGLSRSACPVAFIR